MSVREVWSFVFKELVGFNEGACEVGSGEVNDWVANIKEEGRFNVGIKELGVTELGYSVVGVWVGFWVGGTRVVPGMVKELHPEEQLQTP